MQATSRCEVKTVSTIVCHLCMLYCYINRFFMTFHQTFLFGLFYFIFFSLFTIQICRHDIPSDVAKKVLVSFLSDLFVKHIRKKWYGEGKKRKKGEIKNIGPRIYGAHWKGLWLASAKIYMSKALLINNKNSQEVKLNENIFVKRFIQMESMIFIYSERRKTILKIDDESEKVLNDIDKKRKSSSTR